MLIPVENLAAETLTAIIEQFVLREGTDYGENVYSLEQKVAHVRAQLDQQQVVLVYSEFNESVDILPKREFERMLANENGLE